MVETHHVVVDWTRVGPVYLVVSIKDFHKCPHESMFIGTHEECQNKRKELIDKINPYKK